MRVCLVTCFYGRAEKVERILRMFLDQDYTGGLTLLLFNNSPYEQILDDIQLPENKRIILVNNKYDLETGEDYTNTGDIFRDALTFVPPKTDVVNFFDSDDVFLPNHVTEGVRGCYKAFKNYQLAYKPYYSYFIYQEKLTLEHNTLEPSIFVNFRTVQDIGFNQTSATYHQKWELQLKHKGLMLIDPVGVSTLIYDWGKGHNTFKISGSGDDTIVNLKKHREYETDFGDGVLTPCQEYITNQYYKRVEEFNAK